MEADGDVGIVVEIFYREGGKACEGDGAGAIYGVL